MAVLLSTITPRAFINLFKARTDRIMLYSRGKAISSQVKRSDYELITRAEAHLNGSCRMGFYNMLDNFTVPWSLVVFEEGGVSRNTTRDSLLLVRELQKLGFRGVRREKGMVKGENYNVWLFFDPPVSAKKLRHFFFTLFEKLGFPKETPIIPTSDTLPPGNYGQHVWLPYFNGVDRWMDENNNPYECLGVKQECTIFLDEQGKPIEQNFLIIPKHNERDLDQALTAISSTLATKYLPGVGLVVDENSVRSLLYNCQGFKNIITQIETTGTCTNDGLIRLAALLRALGHEKLLNYYTSKIVDFNEKKLEKDLSTYEGGVFPDCLSMKQIELCPPEKNCFMKTAPLVEYLGFWKEDKKAEKSLEPTVAGWLFKAISERSDAPELPTNTSEETDEIIRVDEDEIPFLEEMPTGKSSRVRAVQPPTKIEVESISKFFDIFTEKLEKKKQDYSTGKRTITGLNSGFEALNEAIDGLIPGSLILLAGEPGAGKSSFAKQILDQVAEKEKIPCLYVSYTLTKNQLHAKTIARLAGVTYRQLNRGEFTDADWQKVAKVNKYVKEKLGDLVYILEADETASLQGIEQALEKSSAGFAIVDCLQTMPAPPGFSGREKSSSDMANLVGLKRICRKKNIPIVVISNSTITSEISYSCDVILYLMPKITPMIASSDKQPYITLLNVEKNLDGPSKITLQYTFFPPRMTYYGEKRIEYKPVEG